MSGGDELISLADAQRSLNWAMRRLGEMRTERDGYRDWFARLNKATAEYIAHANAERTQVDGALAELQDKHSRIVRARTEANIRRGKKTVRLILAMEKDGKSIAETARDLKLSVSHVARVRGMAKRQKA